MFRQIYELLLQWLPNAETLIISNGTHWLQFTNPKDLAEGLAKFFSRHPTMK
jgi:pimeloyl-ACP methyl ester carboxylesterase